MAHVDSNPVAVSRCHPRRNIVSKPLARRRRRPADYGVSKRAVSAGRNGRIASTRWCKAEVLTKGLPVPGRFFI